MIVWIRSLARHDESGSSLEHDSLVAATYLRARDLLHEPLRPTNGPSVRVAVAELVTEKVEGLEQALSDLLDTPALAVSPDNVLRVSSAGDLDHTFLVKVVTDYSMQAMLESDSCLSCGDPRALDE